MTHKCVYGDVWELTLSKRSDAVSVERCSQCGKVAKCSKCAGCLSASYCSRPCQQVAWSKHKQECKQLKALRANPIPVPDAPPPNFENPKLVWSCWGNVD
jgi:hypothetical protein